MKITKRHMTLAALLIAAVLSALGYDVFEDTSEQNRASESQRPSSASRSDGKVEHKHTNTYAKKQTGSANGEFDYYALVMTWSPTYCAENAGDKRTAAQCSGRRPYAFVLHGLWPQFNKGYPESCQTKDNWVPKDVINKMLDIMPAKGLIIHQWRKHGTCSGLAPREFFNVSHQAYKRINIPSRYRAPKSPIYVTPQQIERDFLKTNPQMTEDMIAVSCGSKRRLREIRICMTKDLKLTNCGSNENQRRLCRQKQVVMPPVR